LKANGQWAVRYVLPDLPLLARDSGGVPVFSLTLILARQPQPDEDNISPLIHQGVLSLDATLALVPALLESLRCRDQVIYRSLFASNVSVSLLADKGNTILSNATTTGSNARVALHANLTAAQTQAVLTALNSQASGLQVSAQVRYPVVTASRQVSIHASWAAIHDHLSTNLNDRSNFDGATLKQQFSVMMDTGVIMVRDDTGQFLSGATAGILYATFLRLASVVIRCLTPELTSASPENRYTLRERPNAMFNLNYTESTKGQSKAETVITADLCDIIGGQLPREQWDRHVHLVSPNVEGGMGPVLRRVRTRSERRSLTQATVQPVRLAVTEKRIQSVALAIGPQTRSSTSLLANASLRPALGEVVGARPSCTWLVDDLVLAQESALIEMSLPMVDDDIHAVVWSGGDWYAPTFILLRPAPTDSPTESPFLFEYQTTGITADGKPALLANVRFKVEISQSDEVKRELHRLGKVHSSMVTINDLSIALEIPFVDENGVLRTHCFPAEVSCQGNTLSATVALLNDWARLCYGALAIENFQRQPVRLRIGYAFSGYVPIQKNEVELVFGGKAAITPVVYSSAEIATVKEAVFLDAATASLHVPAGVLKLKHESLLTRAAGERIAVTGGGAQTKFAKAMVTAVALRPQLAVTAEVIVPNKTRYARRSIVRQESHDAFYSCNTLGAFYRERSDSGTQAIGCRDALQLGQTVYRQYEEMVALRHAKYRVYRSLQQPGRFLVLPAQYAITRHVPEQSTAYRPCAILYSLIDASDATNNRVVFEASLQPDVPFSEERALIEVLSSHAASPILEYPTEVMNGANYKWAIDTTLSEPVVIELGDSIRVAIDMSLSRGLLLQNMLNHAGIRGRVDFTLGDGTTLPSTLVLDLNNIIGPWRHGPVSLRAIGGSAQLINNIEQSVTVSVLHRFVGGSKTETIPVNTTLSAG